MDSEVSDKIPHRQLRRSTRQSSASAQAVNYEPTPRGPLKRAKKSSKPQFEAPAVNGTNDTDDEDSPKKKSRSHSGDILTGEHGHGPPEDESEPMETQDKGEGQEDVKRPVKSLQSQNRPVPGHFGDFHLKPYVVLGERCTLNYPESESVTKTQVEQQKKRAVSPSKHTSPTTPPNKTYGTHHVTVTSMADYKRKMEANITENAKMNLYVPIVYPISVTTTTRKRTNDSSTQKSDVAKKKQETKKNVSQQRTEASSIGLLRYFWRLVLLMLLSAGLLLAFKHLSTLQRTKHGSAYSPRSVNLKLFAEELSRVTQRFPSQRPELWKRSQIHLQKHLDLAIPTEPVSMILTAGVRVQKTLFCLAHSIASAFSSALNTSFVVIDGATQSNLDSDQVKMDIDSQLKAAFGSDKLAAVVHRFEELPPGSTLIFYRYCDHETAAYKRAFILFTVLLSEVDLSTHQSLKEVEEMVRDHIEAKFVNNETAFNKMDADKFSGLWSRIAHLILPVVYEDKIEQQGC